MWRLVEPTTHGRASGKQAADPPLQLTHSDPEVPPHETHSQEEHTASRASESPGQSLVSSHGKGLSCEGRHLPGRGTVGPKTNPGGGEALARPLEGEPPSTSNSAASDQQGTDHQRMAAPPPPTLVTGIEAHVMLPAQLQPRRTSLCRSCNPATALSFHPSSSSGGLGPCGVGVERKVRVNVDACAQTPHQQPRASAVHKEPKAPRGLARHT